MGDEEKYKAVPCGPILSGAPAKGDPIPVPSNFLTKTIVEKKKLWQIGQ